jgi:hypothetical protein
MNEAKIFFLSSKKIREKQKTRLKQWTFKKTTGFPKKESENKDRYNK